MIERESLTAQAKQKQTKEVRMTRQNQKEEKQAFIRKAKLKKKNQSFEAMVSMERNTRGKREDETEIKENEEWERDKIGSREQELLPWEEGGRREG